MVPTRRKAVKSRDILYSFSASGAAFIVVALRIKNWNVWPAPYIRDPANGFVSMTLPIKNGAELSLKVG